MKEVGSWFQGHNEVFIFNKHFSIFIKLGSAQWEMAEPRKKDP
jgi:hypothetical protein